METKKISFGFIKTKKAEKPVVEEKKDFIECVEEKSIKVIGGDEIKQDTPLIIPMKPNSLITAERLKEIAEKVENSLEEPELVEKEVFTQHKVPENETLDQMAVRELLQDAKKDMNIETTMLTVPLPAKPINEGEKESTLDDYEAVPVQDFGLAMLRGMGWAPGNEKSSYKQPDLRPKGLGLGADKVVKGNQKQKPAKDSKGEELTIVKNAYVKITTGKYCGYYGKIISLDEDTGRVMVDIAVKKETVSLSEFMMQPVTKSEFDKESKVINAGSFEEYKKKETLQKSARNVDESTPDKNTKDKTSEREGTSSKNYEIKYERDEKTSRHVDSKYYRDENLSRSLDKKNDKDEKSSRSIDNKYDKDEKSSRNVESNDRPSKSSNEIDKNTKNGKGFKDENRRERDRDRSHRKQRRDSTEEISSRKNKRHSSSESLESLSDNERKNKKKNKRHSSDDSSSESDVDRKRKTKKKERRRHNSSDSEQDYRSKRNKTPEGKRDIDKKRKGKKKKRDRDRSPNYRKHRK